MPDKPREERRPSGRAFWSGTITFGLVNIPVDLYPAVRSRETSMKMVDTQGRALGRRYYCPKHKKPLDSDELVRGYETGDGTFVIITDEELEHIAPELTRDIELRRFVPLDQIAPKYFDHPYVLAPAGRSRKAYQLLARAIHDSKRVGVGTFAMRGHQYLVAVLSDGCVLRAETLRFVDEIRSPEDLELPARSKRNPATMRKLAKLVDAHTHETLDEDELTDRYAQKLRDLAEAKLAAGKDVIDLDAGADGEDDEPTSSNVIDLMKILRQRLGADASSAGPTNRKHTSRSKRSNDIADLPKKALYERARRRGVPGRTKMSRKQLIDALRD